MVSFVRRALWAILLSFLMVATTDALTREQIVSLVRGHHDVILREVTEGEDFTQTLAIGGVQSAHPFDGGCAFYCGGSGMGPDTYYTGFFYASRQPDVSSAQPHENGWLFQGEGDNRQYMEKLCDHFYYYWQQY